MKTLLYIGFFLVVVTVLALLVIFIIKRQIADVPRQFPVRDMHIGSLYICVKDMDRAIRFYENFFEQQVTVRDEIYSVFQIYGFRFGLFAYEKKNEPHTFGSNCLPSIAMANVELLKEKIQDLPMVFPLTQIGPNWVAEFEDSEGNHVEVTAPVQ